MLAAFHVSFFDQPHANASARWRQVRTCFLHWLTCNNGSFIVQRLFGGSPDSKLASPPFTVDKITRQTGLVLICAQSDCQATFLSSTISSPLSNPDSLQLPPIERLHQPAETQAHPNSISNQCAGDTTSPAFASAKPAAKQSPTAITATGKFASGSGTTSACSNSGSNTQ